MLPLSKIDLWTEIPNISWNNASFAFIDLSFFFFINLLKIGRAISMIKRVSITWLDQ